MKLTIIPITKTGQPGMKKDFFQVDEIPVIGGKPTPYSVWTKVKKVLSDDDELNDQYDFYVATETKVASGKTVTHRFFQPHSYNTEITENVCLECIKHAQNCDDIDSFMDSVLGLGIWDKENVSKKNRKEWLENVYNAVHRPFREVVAMSGMTKAAFARHFCMPIRTLENYVAKLEPPFYLSLSIQENLGFFHRK